MNNFKNVNYLFFLKFINILNHDKEIVESAAISPIRVGQLRVFSSQLQGEDLLVEFVLLEQDGRSHSDIPAVSLSAAIAAINKTISSGDFEIDMSGFTGSKDIFSAVESSFADEQIIKVNQSVIYKKNVVKTGFPTGTVVGVNIAAIVVGAIFGTGAVKIGIQFT